MNIEPRIVHKEGNNIVQRKEEKKITFYTAHKEEKSNSSLSQKRGADVELTISLCCLLFSFCKTQSKKKERLEKG